MPRFLFAFLVFAAPVPAIAQDFPDGFETGPVIEAFGPAARIEGATALGEDASFRVAFDVTQAAEPGEINRALVSAARFLNMHAAAGVDPERIDLAIVVHGPASVDMSNAGFYAGRHDGAENANAAAIATLARHGVRIIQCGQSATAHGIAAADLLPEVEMALSAMTAHALLQQQGYTLNPF